MHALEIESSFLRMFFRVVYNVMCERKAPLRLGNFEAMLFTYISWLSFLRFGACLLAMYCLH